jgi:hypothetical protein
MLAGLDADQIQALRESLPLCSKRLLKGEQ